MSAPSALPAHPDTSHGITLDGLWHSVFRAMASSIRVQLRADSPDPARCFATVRDLFAEVERQCTRFDPASDLMRANAAGESWQMVGEYCLTALEAAYDAHLMTDRMFEPRVLETLAALGYGASWAAGTPAPESVSKLPPPQPEPWAPGFDETRQAVRVGPRMIDLGGIGKGLTLRWAAELLRERGCDTFLVDAGGDLVAAGGGPDGSGWRVGVEDPFGGAAPVAVLNVVRGACATSSTRLRRWRAGGQEVHHLIDPRTGRSGGQALRSVTVVTDDPAEAEVWSKTLFLHGDALATVAADRELAALWVSADKLVDWTEPMAEYLLWWPT